MSVNICSGRKSGHRLNIDWRCVPILGKLPDALVALEIGCSNVAVRDARKRLGIAPPPRRRA